MLICSCKKNGLIYVGCTINSLEKRFGEHLSRCFTSEYKSKLYNSMSSNAKKALGTLTRELNPTLDSK